MEDYSLTLKENLLLRIPQINALAAFAPLETKVTAVPVILSLMVTGRPVTYVTI